MTEAEQLHQLPIVAHIRHNQTGEIRFHNDYILTSADRHGDDSSMYIWEEGNYSCDCARAQFFAEANGEGDPNIPCSHGRYSVNIYRIDTGECVFREFEEPS